MNVLKTLIDGVSVVENECFSDHRGSFSRLFCDESLDSILNERKIVQINLSKTKEKGSIRGIHFQHPPFAEMKLIRCLRGKVFDVAVDLRSGSKTFLKWYAQILSPEKNNMMIIPEGCGHAFQTMEADTELLYLHTSHYEPNYEGGLLFDDPALNIEWPMVYTDISERDKGHPVITKIFSGIVL